MPTLTNANTMGSHAALTALVQRDWPFAGVLRMRRLARALTLHLEDVDAERRKLLDRYAAKDERGALKTEKGQAVFADDAVRAAFGAAVNELMAATWDCPADLVLRREDFHDPKGAREMPDIRGADLIALGELFEDGEPPKLALVKDEPPAPEAPAA